MRYWFCVCIVLWTTPWSAVASVFFSLLWCSVHVFATDAFCISHQRICTWKRKEHYISSWRNIILWNHPVKLAAWSCHLLVCCSALSTASIAFFIIMMCAFWHLTLYRNYVVLPWCVIWDRTSLLAFHSYFGELLFGLYSSVCWWVICSRLKWLCLHLCRQDVSVHAFLVSNIVYVARLCVVCKAVFFNHQHYQHGIIIERCWSALQRDHKGTPNHWVVIQILSERVSFL